MSKRYSKKFWIIFWSVSILFLAGWHLFWQLKNHRTNTIDQAIALLPIGTQKKEDFQALNHFADYFLRTDNQEKTFMVLFQNNMELRPGGGYIGSFGILKTKNGKIINVENNDLSNFDSLIPNTEEPPYPLKDVLHIPFWKLRDSNFSPDFSQNAQKAEYFYHLGQGKENMDGVMAINANVLTSFLKVTGPIVIPGYPGTYDSENAILALEYQVEKGYAQQGLSKEDRKSIMDLLADEITKKVFDLSSTEKIKLVRIILEDLRNKDIQLYFKDSALEEKAQKTDWAGRVNQNWPGDYLMMVDANLGSYKSDYYIKRSFDYTVDFSKNAPEADLKITYTHTAKQKDWMTKNYLSYLRIYVPENAWFRENSGTDEVRFAQDFGKKYAGSLVSVPLDSTKTIEFTYQLPENIQYADYKLMIQKQSGIGSVPGKVTIIDPDGSQKVREIELKKDWILNSSS